jgi:hypothetical protein
MDAPGHRNSALSDHEVARIGDGAMSISSFFGVATEPRSRTNSACLRRARLRSSVWSFGRSDWRHHHAAPTSLAALEAHSERHRQFMDSKALAQVSSIRPLTAVIPASTMASSLSATSPLAPTAPCPESYWP